MHSSKISVRTLADIHTIESTPLLAHGAAHSSYEVLQNASEKFPDKTGLKYFIDGHCYNPRQIPMRARIRALGALLRYRRHTARPYEEFTFGQMFERVTQTARLFQDCGIGREDVVSLLLPNFPETMFSMLAGETVGIVNPINPLLEPEIIQSIMVNANTRVLVTVGGLPGSNIWDKVKAIRDKVPSLRTIIIVRGDCPPECLQYNESIAQMSSKPLPMQERPKADDVASLFHTGGTTGLPKLVRGTHRNKIANAQMLILVSPLTSDDVGLIALPMFHVNAAINCLIGLLLGMTTVVAGPAGFRTSGVRENFLKILETQRISYFSAVPTIFSALLQQPDIAGNLSSVRFAISAAAALPIEVMRAFTEKTGIRILEGYGQTEATVATCLNPYMGASKPGSVGLRLPYTKVKTALIGEDGSYQRDCAQNEIGHLLITGDHVSVGYLNPQHDQTLWVRDTEGLRWLNSGDLARIDGDGFVWLTGRFKELIIRGGHNIDPRMIEEALQSHPDVVMAAAIGRPDLAAGEVPVAYVTLAPGSKPDADELMRHATRHIPERAAWPKSIQFMDELPLTAIGKVFKPRLIQLEQESAYSEALQHLRPYLSALEIEVRPHLEHGLQANIGLKLKDEHNRVLITDMVAEAMGPYASRYSLNFTTHRKGTAGM